MLANRFIRTSMSPDGHSGSGLHIELQNEMIETSRSYISSAADAGYPGAMRHRAKELWTNDSHRQEAIYYWQGAASYGDPMALIELGEAMFETADGDEGQVMSAAALYEIAQNLSVIEIPYNVDHSGQGIDRDFQRKLSRVRAHYDNWRSEASPSGLLTVNIIRSGYSAQPIGFGSWTAETGIATGSSYWNSPLITPPLDRNECIGLIHGSLENHHLLRK